MRPLHVKRWFISCPRCLPWLVSLSLRTVLSSEAEPRGVYLWVQMMALLPNHDLLISHASSNSSAAFGNEFWNRAAHVEK